MAMPASRGCRPKKPITAPRASCRQPDGSYAEIGLEQALDEIAEKLGKIIEANGPEALGVFCGNGGIFNSTAEGMHRSFLASMGSDQYFSTLTIDQSAKYVSFGRMGGWAPGLPDFDRMDTALLVSVNPLVSHGGYGFLTADPVKNLKRAKARGLKLIVIDPRRTETAKFADIFVQPIPGQDAAVIGGIIRIILEEGWEDKAFCADHIDPEGLTRLREMVAPFIEDYVVSRAGILPGQLREVAQAFARDCKVGGAGCATGINMIPYSNMTQHLLDALNAICGRYLREGEPVHRRNVFSPPSDVLAMVVPPMRPWEADGPSRVRGTRLLYTERPTGTLADEILTPGRGRIRAMIFDGGDPMSSFPDQKKVARALDDLELSVTIDCWPSATAKRVDYVIPPFMQYERADMSMDLAGYGLWPRGWAQYTPARLSAPQGSELAHDWYVFWSIAKRLGKVISYLGKEELDMETAPVCDDLLAIRLKGAVITLDELKQYPHGHDFGTGDQIVRPAPEGMSGRLDVMPPDVAAEFAGFTARDDRPGHIERDGKWYTHLLASRRQRNFFNSNGVFLRTTRKRDPFNPAYLSPGDLAELGLVPGQKVELESAFGRTVAVAEEDPDLRKGVVTLAHGWPGDPDGNRGPEEVGSNVNNLIDTDRHVEPINAMPHMSAVPVNIRALG